MCIGMDQIMEFNCGRENYVRANAFSLYMPSISWNFRGKIVQKNV